MAYVDQNGLVLIDEAEAAEDIKKLNSAKETMTAALDIINSIANINSGFKGDTSDSINYSVVELIKKIDAQKVAIEEEIQFITQTVEKYETLDSKMKNQINSSLM